MHRSKSLLHGSYAVQNLGYPLCERNGFTSRPQ